MHEIEFIRGLISHEFNFFKRGKLAAPILGPMAFQECIGHTKVFQCMPSSNVFQEVSWHPKHTKMFQGMLTHGVSLCSNACQGIPMCAKEIQGTNGLKCMEVNEEE
jgi:hypothetical protein